MPACVGLMWLAVQGKNTHHRPRTCFDAISFGLSSMAFYITEKQYKLLQKATDNFKGHPPRKTY